jgi:hypothetical protein
MSDKTAADHITIVHFESATYLVSPERAGNSEYRYTVHRLTMPATGAQDLSMEEDPLRWSLLQHLPPVPFAPKATAMDAVKAALSWLRSQHDGEVTLEWVQESLMPRLVGVARDAGLDSSGWSFDQHAGLSWTLMDAKPGPGQNPMGMWQRWQDARHAIEGWIEALLVVRHQRDTGRAPADA